MSNKVAVALASVHRVDADGIKIFYREAGPEDGPVLLLLHGFPASSFQYRELMLLLADRYRVIAPDLPGFGFTEVPESRGYVYSFEYLAETMLGFTQALGLERYALYIFDYGAPVGIRLAMAQPDRITAIISQNGNAYEEGIRAQYTTGVPDPALIKPEGYTLDIALLGRPGNMEIQLDLFLDYANNVKLYPAFQEFFRQAQPKLLAIWGKNDLFFLPAGAEAFRRDIPRAKVQLLDTGHFALETHVREIAEAVGSFLA